MQVRNNPSAPPVRPLSARSVVASTLLGTEGLTLPGRALVRAGELFGIAEGTTRVALSRMAAAGELVAEEGRYRLSGPLLERSAAQETGRRPRLRPWRGDWSMAVVQPAGPRAAGDRLALRTALRRLDLAEWREGVWLRPDNLGDPAERLPDAARVVHSQCQWLTARLPEGEDRDMAARLWDLPGWAAAAEGLLGELRGMQDAGEREMNGEVGGGVRGEVRGGADGLRPGFLLAAAVVRHLAADPLLPPDLLPGDWPGARLRETYDRFEAALQRGLRQWFREGSQP